MPPGWLTEDEAACLTELARTEDVLEVGTFLGRSTVAMARVCRSIMTVDPHTGAPEVREAIKDSAMAKLLYQPDGSYDSLPACVEYLQHFGVRDKVALVVARFEDIAGALGNHTFGMVFVDGDHSYQRAHDDLVAAMRLGGRVIFHDHEATWPEVVRAAAELASYYGREVRQLAGSLAELAPPRGGEESARDLLRHTEPGTDIGVGLRAVDTARFRDDMERLTK